MNTETALMERHPPLMQSKINPPRVAGLLLRPRLDAIFSQIRSRRLALLVAGAGYGKTVLACQSLCEMDARTAWYRLDETDRDFSVFIRYLVAALEPLVSGSQNIRRGIEAGATSPKRQDLLLKRVIGALQTDRTEDLFIVLDDFHHVQDSAEIRHAVETLLSLSPPRLHWILIARTEPVLKLSRLRAMMEVIEINEALLTFSIDEIEGLRSQIFPASAGRITSRQLLAQTEGWIAGLVLMLGTLENRPHETVSPARRFHNHSNRHVFQYLEENIFANLPEIHRLFMLKSSLLEQIDPAFCECVFGTSNTTRILETLCRDHLLTFRCAGKAHGYYYHQLLRDFLLDRLGRTVDGSEIRRLHLDIAKGFEDRGDIQSAVGHYMQASDFDSVCRLLSALTLNDLVRFPLPFLARTIARIPCERMAGRAGLLHLRAKLDSISGDVQGAIDGFKAALEQFRTQGNQAGTAACLKDLAFHHYLTGDIVRAQDGLKALQTFRHDDPFFAAEINGYLILFAAISGAFNEADRLYTGFDDPVGRCHPTLGPLVGSWLDLCYSNRLLNSGDFNRAAALDARTLERFEAIGMQAFLPLANFQSAMSAYYTARHREGLDFAEAGLAMADKVGIYDHQYAWLRLARCLNASKLGQIEQALMDASDALAIFGSHANRWGQASVYEALSMIHRHGGRLDEAADCMHRGLQLIEGLNLKVTRQALVLRKVELLLDTGAVEQARAVLDDCCGPTAASTFHHFGCLLLASRLRTIQGNETEAGATMQEALSLAETYGYGPWLAEEAPWAVSVLLHCHARGRSRAFIDRWFREYGTRTRDQLLTSRGHAKAGIRKAGRELLAAIPATDQSLHVRCMGGFEVAVGHRVLAANRWRSTAARKIFQYLAIEKGFIAKDVLVERLWPEQPPSRTHQRFHVALNALRRLLEPDLKRGMPSSFIVRQNSGYRLETGPAGSIDFRTFLARLETARRIEAEDAARALSFYQQADAIYSGPLFAEDMFDEAFVEPRRYLRSRCLQALERIMTLCADAQQWEQAAACAERYLAIDKCAEPVYRALMKFFFHLGQISRIVETMQQCRLGLAAGMDSTPGKDTEALFGLLTGMPADKIAHFNPPSSGFGND